MSGGYLINAVPEDVWYSAGDGAAYLGRRHLAEFIAGGIAVVGGVGCANQVRGVLQRTCNRSRGKKNNNSLHRIRTNYS